MWNAIAQSGIATMSVDFTQAMWPLKVGLLGLLALSAGGIVYAAVRYHYSQQTTSATEPESTEYRKAA